LETSHSILDGKNTGLIASKVSFMVAFAEVTRRGMWTLFRVENEHCANVAQYKASRDVPLPYRIEPLVERLSLDESTSNASGRTTGAQLAAGASPSGRTPQSGGAGRTPETVPEEVAPEAVTTATAGEQEAGTALRRRRTHTMTGARSIRGMMALAHKQDYEKKRKPDATSHASLEEADHSEDEEEDGDEDEDEALDRSSLVTTLSRRRHKDRDRNGQREADGELREAEELVREARDGGDDGGEGGSGSSSQG
jgi:xenotropic and polytropic retrovirus receptor 1